MAQKIKKKVGRPSKITPETLAKLEEAFAVGATDLEACFYANISQDVLYDYQRINPQFADRKQALKETPVLKARMTVVNAISEPEHAKWYLTRKKKDEFSEKTEVDQNITFEPITFTIKGKRAD